jgi:hypothetical protein
MTKPKYSMPKSETRLAIEEALKTGTRESPINAAEIAEMTGLSISLVRTHVNNCIERHQAHNVNTPGQVGAAYAWGRKPEPGKSPNVAQPRQSTFKDGDYDGRELRPFTGRAGAMDAYGLPSDGRPRVRPIIISAGPEVRI